MGSARSTEPIALVFGNSGVPYVLADVEDGHQIKGVTSFFFRVFILGELWLVDNETMLGLDEYEGVPKDYYDRREISVTCENQSQTHWAYIYRKKSCSDELRSLPRQTEYTLEWHQKNYLAINHILVKQVQSGSRFYII